MPLKIKNAPAPNFEELKKHIDLPVLETEDHSENIPHKVFTLSRNDLLSGKGFANMKLAAWRYIFKSDDEAYHVAEIGIDEVNDLHELHHINMGSHVNHFIRLYESIHDHGSVQEKDYEIHVLRVPACFVHAVLLKGHDHEHEFVVPLAPVHSKFEAGKHYEADEFMASLEEIAQEMAAAYPQSQNDLTKIEGIGPKIAEILKKGGISTYEKLAESSYQEIEALMAEAGPQFNLHDATTWPKQAKMAANNEWEALKKWQDKLQGGKDV